MFWGSPDSGSGGICDSFTCFGDLFLLVGCFDKLWCECLHLLLLTVLHLVVPSSVASLETRFLFRGDRVDMGGVGLGGGSIGGDKEKWRRRSYSPDGLYEGRIKTFKSSVPTVVCPHTLDLYVIANGLLSEFGEKIIPLKELWVLHFKSRYIWACWSRSAIACSIAMQGFFLKDHFPLK